MSKGAGRYERIRLLRKVEVPDDGDQLRVTDDGGSTTLSLTAQDYWMHNDSSRDSDGYSALYKAIEDALNGDSTLSGTYALKAVTPSGSSLSNSGLRIDRTDSATGFSLDFNHADFTLDPRLLGWGEDESSQQSSSAGGSGHVIDSPYSLYAVWLSPHAPDDIRDAPRKQAFRSSDTAPWPRTIAFDGPRVRRLRFFAVEGAHWREDAALDASVASNAGLPQNDVHNALQEFLYQGGADNDWLAVYETNGLSIPGGTYEVVMFRTVDALEDPGGSVEDVSGQEQESFEFALQVDPSGPTYQDP